VNYENDCNGNCEQGRRCDCCDDPSAAVRGIVNGLSLSIPLWALIALLVWWLS